MIQDEGSPIWSVLLYIKSDLFAIVWRIQELIGIIVSQYVPIVEPDVSADGSFLNFRFAETGFVLHCSIDRGLATLVKDLLYLTKWDCFTTI